MDEPTRAGILGKVAGEGSVLRARAMTPEELAAWRERVANGSREHLIAGGMRVPDAVALEFVNAGTENVQPPHGGTIQHYLLARFGLRAGEGFIRWVPEIWTSWIKTGLLCLE